MAIIARFFICQVTWRRFRRLPPITGLEYSGPISGQDKFRELGRVASRLISDTQNCANVLGAAGGRPAPSMDHVTIMLCTFNGERFLAEQLDSIANQTHSNWSVVASDDGSSDATMDILRTYQARWGEEKLIIVDGPREGFAQNFMSVLCDLERRSNYYAWADQDDRWLEGKIENGLAWLKSVPDSTPALYCGRTETVTEDGLSVGHSPLFTKPPTFANALVQSIAGGNTMIFNNSACEVLKKIGRNFSIVSHDWWAYLVVSGVGGVVYYDKSSYVQYRQHDANLIGANSSIFARVKRVRMILSGRFGKWNQNHIDGLESVKELLSSENRLVFEYFKKARVGSILKRLINLCRSGVYRQTNFGSCALILAVLTNGL